jgi:hypothetical protein
MAVTGLKCGSMRVDLGRAEVRIEKPVSNLRTGRFIR